LSPARWLIVNADDLGLSAGVNAGIVEAHERGIVTSASLMVRAPAAAAAAAYARRRSELSVGLHVDLGEWAVRDGEWVLRYEVVPTDDPAAVAAEVVRQLDQFRTLIGRDPTHLDSHQHVHRAEPPRSVLIAAAGRLAVPLRHESAVRYCGNFYGQAGRGEPYPAGITVGGLIATLAGLPPGYTELGCHPGWAADLDSAYAAERAVEVETLCDPRVRAAVAELGIELVSFHAVRADPTAPPAG
jgi:chitin disaccharide deacetylase